jgi:hypothetical protein
VSAPLKDSVVVFLVMSGDNLFHSLMVWQQTIKERAYQTLIRPKLEYCCTVWDPHTNENINSLEKVQRRVAMYTCNRHHNTSSVSEMLNTMNWQTLQERRLRTRLINIKEHIVSECNLEGFCSGVFGYVRG